MEECRQARISDKELASGSRRRAVSRTRATIGRRCRDELGLSAAEIARHLGVSASAIARAIERSEKS